jgi:hypothetical protein
MKKTKQVSTKKTEQLSIPSLMEMLAEDEKMISKICDTLMSDLDILCKLTRENGGMRPEIPHTSEVTVLRGSFEGKFVGYGLGQNFLNFGFLENAIADELRERLTRDSSLSVENKRQSVDTMLGGVTIEGKTYETSSGKYRLWHSYTWFIEKLV